MKAVSLLLGAAISAEAVTIYLAGDSTMAKGGGGSGTQGWGEYLKYSVTIPVVNNAIGGRSARSYTREGRFNTILSTVTAGDIVIIEFGHNDGGSLGQTDNGRTDCPGTTTQTCQTTYDGVKETVLTFPAYLQNAAKAIKAKGASVIISSQTPNDTDEGGSFSYTPSRFVDYASLAASAAGVSYVDHGQFTANFYQARSVTTVNSYYPNDHTHTSPDGAALVAAAFVRGVLCGNSSLVPFIKNSTSSVEGVCGNGAAPGHTNSVTSRASTTAKPSQSTTPGDSCTALYGQCGGMGFTGSTRCCSGTCKISNEYYSQCL